MPVPKIIHFAWVGPDEKPQMVLDCIASWKRFCPDFEIREWRRDDVYSTGNRFAIEAFENGKWAFASDVLRLYALKEYGGVYMDSDLLVTAPIDKFLENKYFSGFEIYGGRYLISGWFLGAERGNEIVSDLLAEYDDIPFVLPDGSFDMTPNTARISDYFAKKYNLQRPFDGTATLQPEHGVVIYPSHFFCTPRADKDENYTIHLFNGAWLDKYGRKHYMRIGRVEFARFKRTKKEGKLPLRDGEKLLFLLPIRLSGRKKLAVIRRGSK